MAKAIAKLYELRGIKKGRPEENVTERNIYSKGREQENVTERNIDREEIAKDLDKSPKEVSKLATIGKSLIAQWHKVLHR